MRGIILAGGLGTRLYPITKVISKQLLSVYDKPMIYYPLSVLMLAGIKDILLISTPEAIRLFQELFKDSKDLGINISYKIQETPRGLADAFILGEDFIQDRSVALVLGDNIFYGSGFSELLDNTINKINVSGGAIVFGYKVKDPQRFGVVEFNLKQQAISIEEKPNHPKSDYAVTGLYFYDNKVVEYTKSLKTSSRGELEITDLNNIYLKNKQLSVEILGRGFAWLDTGTPDSLMQAANFVQSIEENQGLKIACLEEIAYYKHYISKDELLSLAKELASSDYGKYLKSLIHTKI